MMRQIALAPWFLPTFYRQLIAPSGGGKGFIDDEEYSPASVSGGVVGVALGLASLVAQWIAVHPPVFTGEDLTALYAWLGSNAASGLYEGGRVVYKRAKEKFTTDILFAGQSL